MKHGGRAPERHYEDIRMPKNSPLAIVIAAAALLSGFGIIWQIWWLASVGLCGIILGVMLRAFDDDTEYVISASEVADRERMTRMRHAHPSAPTTTIPVL
jgi:cytochrome o ubiquinol oxidase subunit 1